MGLFLISGILSVVAIYTIWLNVIRKQQIQIYTQRLFDLRFELFETIKNNNLSFDSDIHIELRNKINTSIYLLEHLNLSFIIITLLYAKLTKFESDREPITKTLGQELSEDVYSKLMEIEMRTSLIIGLCLIKSNLFFYIIGKALHLILLIVGLVLKISSVTEKILIYVRNIGSGTYTETEPFTHKYSI